MKMLKVGELSKRASISIRTLHHYDKIGLLKPTATSSVGYRLYQEADVVRLQQIVSLKEIGFSLEQISELLNKQDINLTSILIMQKEVISKRVEQLQQIESQLNILIKRSTDHKKISTEELLNFIKEMKMMNQFYTAEQLQKLQERLAMYPQEAKQVEQEWPILFKQFEEALNKGLAPSDPEVQLLARKAQHFIDLFTGGDKGIEANLDKAYQQNKEQALKTWGVSATVFDYSLKAREIFNKKL